MILPPPGCIQSMTTNYYTAFTSQLGGVVDAHVDSTLGFTRMQLQNRNKPSACCASGGMHCFLHDAVSNSA